MTIDSCLNVSRSDNRGLILGSACEESDEKLIILERGRGHQRQMLY